MEFDKTKIYTAVNADEVKIGSKGYFGDSILILEQQVKNDEALGELLQIQDDYKAENEPFIDGTEKSVGYMYFYLVEVPKEKKYRPYKDTDEMIEDFLERYNNYSGAKNTQNPMYNPLIWIKEKLDINQSYTIVKYLIICFGYFKVWVYNEADAFTMDDLFEKFEYLDGTPCGKLEE